LNSAIFAEVTVHPFGFAVSVDENDEAEIELTLGNRSEGDVAFNIDYRLIIDEDDHRIGPQRDDPGDVLEEYRIPYEQTFGMAWDADRYWMWGTWHHEGHLFAINPEDGEVMEDFRIETYLSGMFYLDGILYLGGWSRHPQHIYRYDTDGNALELLNSPISLERSYIASDGEHLFVLRHVQFRDGVVHVYNLEDFEEIAVIEYGDALDNVELRALEWVSVHPRGQLWISGRDRLYQFYVDREWNCEWIRDFRVVGADFCALAHDGVNLWHGPRGFNRWYVIDDGVQECYMLSIDPETGIIPGEDSETVEITIVPEGYEAGVYNILLEIELSEADDERDDPEQTLIEISAVVSLESPVASLSGIVTDPAIEEAIEGAAVDMDRYVITHFTDEDGAYVFNDLPFGEYEFTFTASDYLPFIQALNIVEAQEYELDIELLHSECSPDPDEIRTELAPDSDMQISIDVHNGGNGPLTYNVERRLPGDANADPWTLRQSVMVGQDREDPRIQGVVFANDHFYVTGVHDNEPAIYIFSREGEYIDMFIQPGNDRYGMKDLAYDGNLIWGSIGQTIYGMTLDGDVEVEFEGPFRPTSNLAWDPEHELLWVSATTSDIAAINRNGNLVSELDRQDLRMYGFAYWPDDPDDSPLYIFDKMNDVGDQVVHKMNVDNGELTLVSILEPEGGGNAAGAFITNEYDIYSWVFIAVANARANDRVDVWQIDARKDWFLLDPTEGVIEADDTQEFELTLDATGLPPAVFEGELVFLHDGVGSETHIPVTLAIVEGPVQAQRTIELDIGWNMVSVNLQPDPDDIRALMQELVEAELLLLMKDGQGRFYSPEFDFCNIPGWNVADGYQIKMDEAGELTVEGITVMVDDAIPLTEGWNLISYYPRTPVDAIVAFSRIVDQLLMTKDGWGRFYNPEWGFSNMGDLEELRGYQVKVTEDLELVYRLQAEDDDFVMNVRDRQAELPTHPNTGNNMSLLVKGGSISDGEIGVYANDELVGSGVLENGVCGIAVWGDDLTTPEIDGALVGASLEMSLLDENGSHPVQFETFAGNGLYQIDGLWVVELKDITMLPDEFGIVSAYPNPFNNQTYVTYNLSDAAQVDMALFDLSGRRVMDIATGPRSAGQYAFTIDGVNLASGIYIVQLEANGDVSRSKITLMK